MADWALKVWLGNCYGGRKSQYQPMWLSTDLQVTNVTIE